MIWKIRDYNNLKISK